MTENSAKRSHPYLIFDTTGVIDDTDTSGIGSNIQPLDDLCQEDFDLLKL